MSHRAVNWALGVRGLKPVTKIVLIQLSDRHNRDTGQCDPSQERLAYDCEISRATLNRHLDELEFRGYIQRQKRFDSDRHTQKRTYYILKIGYQEEQHLEGRVSKCDTAFSDEPCLKNDESRVSKTPDPVSQIETLTMEENREGNREYIKGAESIVQLELAPFEAAIPEPQKPAQMHTFSDWWDLYPRKVGMRAAEKAFDKAVKRDGVAKLFEGLALQAPMLRQKNDAGRPAGAQNFCPHPATWLNEGRYLDEVEKPEETFYQKIERRLNEADTHGKFDIRTASEDDNSLGNERPKALRLPAGNRG